MSFGKRRLHENIPSGLLLSIFQQAIGGEPLRPEATVRIHALNLQCAANRYLGRFGENKLQKEGQFFVTERSRRDSARTGSSLVMR